jgi:hypothetical protein
MSSTQPQHLILLASALAFNVAASEFEQAECSPNKEHNEGVYISINKSLYHITEADRDCHSNYLISKTKDGTTTILAGPSQNELGENAQNTVYLVEPKSNIAVNIGSIPVEAEPLGENKFVDISQSGGSIYQTTYKINKKSIAILKPTYELSFSGSQCILKNSNSKNCQQLQATFETPICITQINEKKILSPMTTCAEMKKLISNQIIK